MIFLLVGAKSITITRMNTKGILGLVGMGHDRLIFNRRIRLLTERLAPFFVKGERVLDVGSGDGLLARRLMLERPGLTLEGVEVVVRPTVHIPTKKFDGLHIPHPDRSFDSVLIVDVLHHTNEPQALLKEAARVAKKSIIIKDHCIDSWLSRKTITATDWIANRPHGVPLPFNFQNSEQWESLISATGFEKVAELKNMPMYPFPFDRLLNWSHDFIVKLERRAS